MENLGELMESLRKVLQETVEYIKRILSAFSNHPTCTAYNTIQYQTAINPYLPSRVLEQFMTLNGSTLNAS